MGDLEQGYHRLLVNGSESNRTGSRRAFKMGIASICAFSLVILAVNVMTDLVGTAATDSSRVAHIVSSVRARTGPASPTSLFLGLGNLLGGKKDVAKEGEDDAEMQESLAKLKAAGDAELAKQTVEVKDEVTKLPMTEATEAKDAAGKVTLTEFIDLIDQISNLSMADVNGTQPTQEEVMNKIHPESALRLRELTTNPAMMQDLMKELSLSMEDPAYKEKAQVLMQRVMKMWADPNTITRMQKLFSDPEMVKKMQGAMNIDPAVLKQLQDPEMVKKVQAQLGIVNGTVPQGPITDEILNKAIHPGFNPENIAKVQNMMKDPEQMQEAMKKGMAGAQEMMRNPKMMSSVMSQMTEAMKNPEMMNYMTKMMQNPDLMRNAQSMMSGLDPKDLEAAQKGMGPGVIQDMQKMMGKLGAPDLGAGAGPLGSMPGFGGFGAGAGQGGTTDDGLE